MMQVENEVGVLGDSRDRCDAANQAFAAPVPKELLDYIGNNKDKLHPQLRKAWEEAGSKTSGTWEEVFGKAAYTDEIFMAWNYSSYMNRVAAAGKAEYPLPMYVNTWCSMPAPDRGPGTYPSGGPEPQVQNIWKVGAPAIDIRSPDLYSPNFPVWVEWYRESYAPDDPLFIPETDGTTGAYHVFYALGQHDVCDRRAGPRAAIAYGHGAGGPAAGAELRHADATRPGDSREPGQRQDGRRGSGGG
jgi:beta-galactosidase GanA